MTLRASMAGVAVGAVALGTALLAVTAGATPLRDTVRKVRCTHPKVLQVQRMSPVEYRLTFTISGLDPYSGDVWRMTLLHDGVDETPPREREVPVGRDGSVVLIAQLPDESGADVFNVSGTNERTSETCKSVAIHT
jgi:hypothetical protein